MKFFLIFSLIVAVSFAIFCSEDAHCGAPELRATCVDGKCVFTQVRPVNETARRRRSARFGKRDVYSKLKH